jgi:hypothetical protein
MVIREDICWMALAICIMKSVEIEHAFEMIAPDPFVSLEAKRRFKDQKMAELRDEGCTWDEVGQAFGLAGNAAFKRVTRFKRRACNEGTYH